MISNEYCIPVDADHMNLIGPSDCQPCSIHELSDDYKGSEIMNFVLAQIHLD